MPSRKVFDITVEFLHSTEKAIKYTDGETEFWVSKSALAEDGYIQVEDNEDGTFTLTAPERWLKEKGLI
jgi:hypothetical protein